MNGRASHEGRNLTIFAQLGPPYQFQYIPAVAKAMPYKPQNPIYVLSAFANLTTATQRHLYAFYFVGT
jgi:hypothetical protein